MIEDRAFREFALQLAPDVAVVATYCDKVEHNEQTPASDVGQSGTSIRGSTIELARQAEVDIVAAYGERLAVIETRNVLDHPQAFDGRAAVQQAVTWRDLQLVQVEHDRQYHPDVIGLAKLDQLRHYVLHLAKLVGAFASPREPNDLLGRRLPDCLLFAMKLQTVTGSRLPNETLPRTAEARDDIMVIPL